MKKTTKKSLLVTALATFTLSSGALVVNAFPAYAETPKTVADITGQSFAANEYAFAGYTVRFNQPDDATVSSGETAFRYTMQISKALYDYITAEENGTISTGTLINPVGVGGCTGVESLTKNIDTAIDVSTTDYWSVSADDENVYESTAYMQEVPAAYYTAPVAVRGYVQIGEEVYYSDATDQKAACLAEVVVHATWNDEEKQQLAKDAFAKFQLKIDEEEPTEVYYDDALPVPDQTQPAGALTVYLNESGTKAWNHEKNTVKGNTHLIKSDINTKRYYAADDKAATFDIDEAAVGDKVLLNGEEIAEVSEEGKVTLGDLTEKGLTAGGQYLLSVGGKLSGFTYVTAINDYVPYANRDKLWFEELGDYETSAVTLPAVGAMGNNGNPIVSDLNGVRDWNGSGANLVTSAYPAGKNVCKVTEIGSGGKRQFPYVTTDEVLVTIGENVYKITPYIYRDVIYTAEEAVSFFVGTEADSYKVPGFTPAAGSSIALAQDIDMGVMPKRGEWAPTFSGLFDGLGHSLSWTVDGEKIGTPSYGDGSLFGYYMSGIMQNAELDVTYKNLAPTKTTNYYIIATSIWSDEIYNAETNPYPTKARIENMFFNVHLGAGTKDSGALSIPLGTVSPGYAAHVSNILMVRTGNTEKYGSATRLLFNYTYYNHEVSKFDPVKNAEALQIYANEFTNTAGTTLYEMKREYINTENVVCIIPDGNLAGLFGSNPGNRYYAAINQQDIEDIDGSSAWTSNVFFHDSYIYKYTEAKTAERAVKVGNWLVSYGETIEDVTATFVK